MTSEDTKINKTDLKEKLIAIYFGNSDFQMIVFFEVLFLNKKSL